MTAPASSEKKMKKTKALVRLAQVLGVLLALAAGAAGLAVAAALYWDAPPEQAPQGGGEKDGLEVAAEGGTARLEIRPGESAQSVGRRLYEAGLIRNTRFWDFLFYLDKKYLKAGFYELRLPAAQRELRAQLLEGRQILKKVTIPEGVTLKKIAAILEAEEVCSAADFLAAAADEKIRGDYQVPGATMEGYLYPDTYHFPFRYPAEKVVRAMADDFFRRLAAIQGDKKEDKENMEEINRRVIVASIVEREYRVPGEAPLMAGVFYNRLKIGMALQSCATVEYVITEIEDKPHPARLFDRDIHIDNPYNTYVHRGLPPGPISAPGQVALEAAFRPAATDFLYFRLVNPAEGRHYFSKTLDAHIQAASLYVKGGV